MKTQLPRPIGCFLLGNKHKTLRKSSGAHSHLQLNLGRLTLIRVWCYLFPISIRRLSPTAIKPTNPNPQISLDFPHQSNFTSLSGN